MHQSWLLLLLLSLLMRMVWRSVHSAKVNPLSHLYVTLEDLFFRDLSCIKSMAIPLAMMISESSCTMQVAVLVFMRIIGTLEEGKELVPLRVLALSSTCISLSLSLACTLVCWCGGTFSFFLFCIFSSCCVSFHNLPFFCLSLSLSLSLSASFCCRSAGSFDRLDIQHAKKRKRHTGKRNTVSASLSLSLSLSLSVLKWSTLRIFLCIWVKLEINHPCHEYKVISSRKNHMQRHGESELRQTERKGREKEKKN